MFFYPFLCPTESRAVLLSHTMGAQKTPAGKRQGLWTGHNAHQSAPENGSALSSPTLAELTWVTVWAEPEITPPSPTPSAVPCFSFLGHHPFLNLTKRKTASHSNSNQQMFPLTSAHKFSNQHTKMTAEVTKHIKEATLLRNGGAHSLKRAALWRALQRRTAPRDEGPSRLRGPVSELPV